ncbi:LLM class flavin-dependent oxidoreductase [Paenibacillus taichungensis]|uniref:LLM class flavin-dependent oxidoreductase n=1 Tax=Paenibacillus TaxID=44249 RepID=UPI00096FE8A2|nr:LLM class flavin-dependent oxidoreductase [Paenibacillus taichungensis]MDR9745680.1 LLM class flavin-dependent oxidoreductase [Paenibacillus taichungensis]MEC0105851.1 LLM class flavin-dependent oxidoreductase [Paenibacillus taichungensis]MEC0196539.1 LLM class flavin-dependent oxidoreductase [Paenibacillus taichungensis]OME83322.1 nitrilotriacetate monooxygenase [Paenibacillus pabuli]
MSNNNRQLALGAMMFFPAGEHISSWRHPGSEAEGLLDFNYYKRIAQTAERGRFDMFFYADELYVWDRFESGISHANSIRPEPFTLLSALAAVTSHIGLAATISTTYNDPYHIARKLATLDHFSGGRAAWNIVTSQTDEEARNFGKERHLQHELRYERAKEFVEATQGLWDSWEEDALLFDKESGYFADKNKLHNLDYEGTHFKVKGPLNISRPPQGYPVLIQAGASEAGKEVAAATAEIVFAPGGTFAEGKALYEDIKGRLAKYGRSPDEIKILPALMPIIGATTEEAAEQLAIVENLTPDRLALDLLSHYIGVDVSGYPLDEPLPFLPEEEGFNQSKSGLQRIRRILKEEDLTLIQLAKRIVSKRAFAGTPEQIADHIEEWFSNGAADGFNIAFTHLPGALDDFVAEVVPILQRRGLLRLEYEGTTLRDHFGLSKPENRYSQEKIASGTAER